MFNKLKQIQELKSQADQLKKVLAEETVEGVGTSGLVRVVMNGNQEVQMVEIDPQRLNDKEAVERETKEAINSAIKKVQQVMAQKMSQMGGLNLPGM